MISIAQKITDVKETMVGVTSSQITKGMASKDKISFAQRGHECLFFNSKREADIG